MLKRLKAKQDLIAFTEYTNPKYKTAKVHRLIAEQLERVERGEIDRLMLLVPPRHGKSELASRRFPAFALGRRPDRQFISASASSDFASEFGRDVRNLIASQEYKALFPEVRLAEDSQAKNKWNTSDGGAYYSVGMEAQVIGRGAHILMIDDPFGTMEDAQSEGNRKKVYDWYTGTAYHRLEEGGAIVLINHRMHEDDLTGMLLAQVPAGGDAFEVVEFPAVAEDDDPVGREVGEALWPEKYPRASLDRIRRVMSSRNPRFWSALYQQRPTPETGTYFLAEWLKPYTKEQRPSLATLAVYGASDYAVTKNDGDYTVHVVVGVDPEGKLWLLDLWRAQTASDKWVDAWCDLVRDWHPIGWAEETGQIKSGVGPFLDQRARERKAYCARTTFPTRGGDKSVRAQSIRGRMALNGLHVPVDAEWYADLRSELMSFPAGKHDDAVDALGLLGQLLDVMIDGREPKKVDPVTRDGYREAKDDSAASDSFKVY